VASIKPSSPDPHASSGINSGHGRISASSVTLKRCVIGAYGLGPNEIFGGPGWLDSDRFEIIAKAEEPVGDAALMAMLRTLLAERFKLAVHRETRTIPAYVLEVARKGPKLEKAAGGVSSDASGWAMIDAANTTMDHFAWVLARQMDLPVVNRTGLEGAFNLKLTWTPDSGQPARPGGDSGVPDGPSIFTAIQEQLGLRLRSEKTPVAVLVVDHAEKPSEN
jgi:uncharacterized protein (TIGR03435 family)